MTTATPLPHQAGGEERTDLLQVRWQVMQRALFGLHQRGAPQVLGLANAAEYEKPGEPAEAST